MLPIRAKIDGETQSVMVVREPEKTGDQVLVRTPNDRGGHSYQDYVVTGVDMVAGEQRWHLRAKG